jgi:hypothetical protein
VVAVKAREFRWGVLGAIVADVHAVYSILAVGVVQWLARLAIVVGAASYSPRILLKLFLNTNQAFMAPGFRT